MSLFVVDGKDTVHTNSRCGGLARSIDGDVIELHECGNCAHHLKSEDRVYRPTENSTSANFTQFEGKGSNSHPELSSPLAKVNKDKIRFNSAAQRLGRLKEHRYINYYISSCGTKVGVKPVSNGEVGRDSYTLVAGGTLSFTKISQSLVVDFNFETERFEVEWSDEDEMLVIDFSSKQESADV